jgi:hypothetical protein
MEKKREEKSLQMHAQREPAKRIGKHSFESKKEAEMRTHFTACIHNTHIYNHKIEREKTQQSS